MSDAQPTAKPWLFKPGTSGNPAGRAKGSYTRDSASVLAKARRAALRTVIERASQGDLTACDILLRHNPPRD